jgi:glucose/arabinose dehydrogenase
VRLFPLLRGLPELTYLATTESEPGRLYVVERRGMIVAAIGGRVLPTPFLDIRRLVNRAGERGLLSMAFDPSYASNGAFYVDFVDARGRIHVARYTATNGVADPSTRRDLLVVPSPSPFHNGGQLAFGPDDRLLYVSIGDGGIKVPAICKKRRLRNCRLILDPGNAQSLATLRGKILRLAPDATELAAPRVVAYGLRNPWRFSFDRSTGDMYIGDVGLDRVEEVDVLPRGSALINFGWSVWEGRVRRPGATARVNPMGTLHWPVATYMHRSGNCSIIGGYVYRGAARPALRGRYVYGDYCSGRVWSFKATGRRATSVRLEPIRIPKLVSFAEDDAGELYAITDSGTVFALR